MLTVSLRDAVFLFFMRLTINGKEIDSPSTTVGGLLEELGILSGRVAVEVNLSIVKKPEYVTFSLKEGDTIEIVNFVGGGDQG